MFRLANWTTSLIRALFPTIHWARPSMKRFDLAIFSTFLTRSVSKWPFWNTSIGASSTKWKFNDLIPSFTDVLPTFMTSSTVFSTKFVLNSVAATDVSFFFVCDYVNNVSLLDKRIHQNICLICSFFVVLSLLDFFLNVFIVKSCGPPFHRLGFSITGFPCSTRAVWNDNSCVLSIGRIIGCGSFVTLTILGFYGVEWLAENVFKFLVDSLAFLVFLVLGKETTLVQSTVDILCDLLLFPTCWSPRGVQSLSLFLTHSPMFPSYSLSLLSSLGIRISQIINYLDCAIGTVTITSRLNTV